jgi:putative FmdB family regulatory protein
MPIYEYRCGICSKVSELLVGVNSKKTEIICKYCGSDRLEKIFSVNNVMKSSGKMPCGQSTCVDGSCGVPHSSCPGGMCGL